MLLNSFDRKLCEGKEEEDINQGEKERDLLLDIARQPVDATHPTIPPLCAAVRGGLGIGTVVYQMTASHWQFNQPEVITRRHLMVSFADWSVNCPTLPQLYNLSLCCSDC